MRRALLTVSILALHAGPLLAQRQDLPPGVQLETRYTLANRPALAVQPFASAEAVAATAGEVTAIVENDLRLSNRFQILPTPERLATAPTVDYAAWNSLNVVYLVAGEVTALPQGFQLRVTVHDVVYGTVRQTRSFALPLASSPDFRLAVHVASDEIVRWITNQPGMAASRIAFVRQNMNGRYDLLVVDSDGENLRRIFGSEMDIYSPTWSPDGRRLAYTMRQAEGWRLVERDMATGQTRTIHSTPGLIVTPTYSPDGSRMVFGVWVGGGVNLHEFDLSGNCCLRRITETRAGVDNMSPTFSPDGRRLAFFSNRAGWQHIYVMPAGGGNATILSPLGERVAYNAPAWSPTGSQVIFHGDSRGSRHLMLADANRPGGQVMQLTSQGWNEDPAWAPDGRHIVYTVRAGGDRFDLYVIDTVTGNTRALVTRNGRLRLADWSPSLAATVSIAASQ
jgi:TolB protein